jgi:hypothetical protein
MRYRYVLVSLVGLMAGCQSLCPLRHSKSGSDGVAGPAAQAQPTAAQLPVQPGFLGMPAPPPLPLDQQLPQMPVPQHMP